MGDLRERYIRASLELNRSFDDIEQPLRDSLLTEKEWLERQIEGENGKQTQ